MNVEGQIRQSAQAGYLGHSVRQIRNKMPVHHVQVKRGGAGGFQASDFALQIPEITLQQRW